MSVDEFIINVFCLVDDFYAAVLEQRLYFNNIQAGKSPMQFAEMISA